MANLLKDISQDEIKNAATSMIVSTVKSIARHNKRAAELLLKAKELIDPNVEKHNSFLDDILQILKPVLHIAHSVLENLFPSYMHIIDWVIGIFTEVVQEATA
jgi:hypothetical protein